MVERDSHLLIASRASLYVERGVLAIAIVLFLAL